MTYRAESGAEPTTDEIERINEAIRRADHYGYNLRTISHRYFIVEKFYPMDFRKSSKNPIQKSKFFNLADMFGYKTMPNTDVIANDLNGWTWEEFMESVFEFMSFYGWGEIMNPSVYGKVRRCDKLSTTTSSGGLILALQRAITTARPEGRYRKHCYWLRYKAVLLESSLLESSACSLIYFCTASSVILPIVST